MHAKIKCAALMLLLFSPALLSPLLEISEGVDKQEGLVHHELCHLDGVDEQDRLLLWFSG